jgi:hypothetical protein
VEELVEGGLTVEGGGFSELGFKEGDLHLEIVQ